MSTTTAPILRSDNTDPTRPDLGELSEALLEAGRRFIDTTGDRRLWVLFDEISQERQARLENDVKVPTGRSVGVTVHTVGVIPAAGVHPISLHLGWSHGHLSTPLSPGECLNLAAQLVRAAAL